MYFNFTKKLEVDRPGSISPKSYAAEIFWLPNLHIDVQFHVWLFHGDLSILHAKLWYFLSIFQNIPG